MTEFIVLIIIIIIIIYFISKSKSNKSRKQKPKSVPSTRPRTTKPIQTEENLLYKKIGIKAFDMKGMFHQKLNPKTDNGEFIGFAKCENNSHDMYSVEIYNEESKLLGYTPKGNKRLNFSLNKWHNGKIVTWGYLRHDDYDNKWYGTVYIPVGYTLVQIKKLELFLKLKRENESQINLKEKETSKYFEILNKHREISELLGDLKNPKDLYYSFPKNLIPSISNHLEKERNWEKLIELEKYQDLINELNDKYKKTTFKRISDAKENIN
jgi:hypothetical protein